MSRPITALLAVIVLLAALPAVAVAETRTGGTVVVGPDETIDDDLETVAGSVVVEGTVTGDLEAAGGDVRIAESGRVVGDLETAGGSAEIAGDVGGSVEAAGGSVRVTDTAQIGGSLQASAGSIVVDGTVGGDAELAADTVRLGPNAVLQGDLTYDGELVRDDGATVEGTVTRDGGIEVGVDAPGLALPELGPLFGVYGALVTLLVGAILLLAFPGFSREVADHVADDPVRTGGIGLLAAIAIPVVLVMVLVTIIGIPLSLAGFVLYALLAWVATVYGRYAVGEWLVSHAGEDNPWLALVVGVVAVAVVGLVPLLGSLVETVVFVLGFGALVVALRRRYGDRTEPEAESSPAPPTDADAV